MTDQQTISEEKTPPVKRATKKKAAPKKRKPAIRKKAKRKTAKKSPPQGRPKGSKTVEKPESVGTLTRCRVCDSTERSRYTNPRTLHQVGTDPEGNPYNQVTWRNTSCLNCGQVRIDKTYELITPKE